MSILSLILKPVAYLGVPVYILTRLSASSPVARYYVRLTLYVSTLGLCSVWGAIVSVVLSLSGQRFNVNWVVARSFYALASRVLDIKIVVEGEEHLDTRPAVFVGNHQSMLDILYLGRIFPMRASIMAKKELQWMPLLGQYLTASGAVFVDRGNNARAVRSLAAAGEAMRSRTTSLWLFPEGTRSMRPYHDLLPFKKGAFHLAVQAGVPIVPVVCENYWRLYRKDVFESGTLRLRVLPPVPTTGLTADDVSELAERVHAQMVEALRDISDLSAPAPPPTKATGSRKEEKATGSSSERAAKETEATPVPEGPTDGTVVDEPATPQSEAQSLSETESARRTGSENGAETEEDEGMVLVGRPR
ncbi:1-acylglycerol-3-phosphate O [Amylostereum chailletii]|nr:1-acylglycerol-3-phosphate O [Amylostereum chailletii]